MTEQQQNLQSRVEAHSRHIEALRESSVEQNTRLSVAEIQLRELKTDVMGMRNEAKLQHKETQKDSNDIKVAMGKVESAVASIKWVIGIGIAVAIPIIVTIIKILPLSIPL